MKLESYKIKELITAGNNAAAARLLLDVFRVPSHIEISSILTIAGDSNKMLIWIGDDYYEWSDGVGFDHGTHLYPAYDSVLHQYTHSVTIWFIEKE